METSSGQIQLILEQEVPLSKYLAKIIILEMGLETVKKE